MKIHSPATSREGLTLTKIGDLLDSGLPPKYKILAIKDIYNEWKNTIRNEYITNAKELGLMQACNAENKSDNT